MIRRSAGATGAAMWGGCWKFLGLRGARPAMKADDCSWSPAQIRSGDLAAAMADWTSKRGIATAGDCRMNPRRREVVVAAAPADA
jgi:hypothetical protein